MEVCLGFLIALAIGLTGVGAGTMTTPLLTILLGLPPAQSVGTALAFSSIVKLVSLPVYLSRKQVNFKIFAFLLIGGIPGVILGSLVLGHIKRSVHYNSLYFLLGGIIVVTALINLWSILRRRSAHSGGKDRSKALPFIALPIGAEVGFSSAGAGALGSILLLNMTTLTTAQVVGTDVCFGLALSIIGGGFQVSTGNYEPNVLWKLCAGGVVGSLVGAYLVGRLPSRPLRIGLLFMLIVLGTLLFQRGFA